MACPVVTTSCPTSTQEMYSRDKRCGTLPPITAASPEPLPPSQRSSISPSTHLWSRGQTSCQAPVIGMLWEKGVPYLGGNRRMLHRAGWPSPIQGASAHQGLGVMPVWKEPAGGRGPGNSRRLSSEPFALSLNHMITSCFPPALPWPTRAWWSCSFGLICSPRPSRVASAMSGLSLGSRGLCNVSCSFPPALTNFSGLCFSLDSSLPPDTPQCDRLPLMLPQVFHLPSRVCGCTRLTPLCSTEKFQPHPRMAVIPYLHLHP